MSYQSREFGSMGATHWVWCAVAVAFGFPSIASAQLQMDWPVVPTGFAEPISINESIDEPPAGLGEASHPLPSSQSSGRLGGRRPAVSSRRNLLSMFGSLTVVLGLFALTMIGLRYTKRSDGTELDCSLVRVMGRTTLLGRHELCLVSVGNKLLLLSISPAKVQTLTEITDVDEVRRLERLCSGQASGRWSVQDDVPSTRNELPMDSVVEGKLL